MGVIRFPLETDKDDRGWVLKGLQYSNSFGKICIRETVIQTINKNKFRGRHYHKKKSEWFLPLKGRAELFYYNISSKEIKKEIMRADSPQLFKIEPNTCHWIRNNGDEEFLMASFSSEEYDPSNPDSLYCKTDIT